MKNLEYSFLMFSLFALFSTGLFAVNYIFGFEYAVIAGIGFIVIKVMGALTALSNQNFAEKQEILAELNKIKEELKELKK